VIPEALRSRVMRTIQSGGGYSARQVAEMHNTTVEVVQEIAADARSATRAPAVSAPVGPAMRWIDAQHLFADETYQTVLDRKKVHAMAAAWREDLLGVLEVSERTGDQQGWFAVVDGQHRYQAAVVAAQGKPLKLLCHVHTGLSPAQEAELYYRLYSSQRKKTALEVWRGRQAAQDEVVLGVEGVLKRFDVKTGHSLRVNQIKAVRVLECIWRAGGEPLLSEVLTTAITAWPDQPDGLGSSHLHGLAIVHAGYGAAVSSSTLGVALQKTMPGSLVGRARELKTIQRYSLPRAMAMVMVNEYNARFRKNPIPELPVQIPLGISNVDGIPLRDFRGRQEGLEVYQVTAVAE
jgi:hypothetical protein